MKTINFLMAGVGGQGTILASNILANTGLELGYDVKTAEVHGMAQRGGTVESHIRWGDKVYSPLVEQGMADYLLGFEALEAARWPVYMKPGSIALVNDFRIPPPLVNMGKAKYPPKEEVQSILESGGARVKWLTATEIAKGLGNPAMVGVVLLGALSNLVGGDPEVWLGAIKKLVPERFAALNQSAFLEGRKTLLS